MMRLLGALLVFLGGAWLGLRASWELRNRERALAAVAGGLTLLAQELELGGLPLDRMLEQLAGRTQAPVSELFSSCAGELRETDREAFPVLWRRRAEACPGLGQEARICLAGLGETLGRCDSGSQRKAVAAACRELERLRLRAVEERSSRGRVFKALGASGGAFLAILLL